MTSFGIGLVTLTTVVVTTQLLLLLSGNTVARRSATCQDFDFQDFQNIEKMWKCYNIIYKKTYANATEKAKRMQIFKVNVRHIEEHNEQAANGQFTFTQGVNQYTELTYAEFKLQLLTVRVGPPGASTHQSKTSPPPEVDWRTAGYVTPVRDQGQCGSCWAFSAAGALEGQWFNKTGTLTRLSAQNLVDCDTNNMGCNGGIMDKAFDFIKSNDGIDTEASYPYVGTAQQCHFDDATIGANCTGHVSLPQGNESALQEAVAAVGPIAIAIYATDKVMFYSRGVFSDTLCSSSYDLLNHAVLVVGYGTSSTGQKYWIIKNSWATTWGDSGYINVARNASNMCGISQYAVYPTV